MGYQKRESMTGQTVNGCLVLEEVAPRGNMRYYRVRRACGCVKETAQPNVGKNPVCRDCTIRSGELSKPTPNRLTDEDVADYVDGRTTSRKLRRQYGVGVYVMYRWLRERDATPGPANRARLKELLAAVPEDADERWVTVCRAYVELGLTPKVADALGISKQRVAQIVDRVLDGGWVRQEGRHALAEESIDPATLAEATAAYARGELIGDELADRLGVCVATAMRVLRRAGVKTRRRGRPRKTFAPLT